MVGRVRLGCRAARVRRGCGGATRSGGSVRRVAAAMGAPAGICCGNGSSRSARGGAAWLPLAGVSFPVDMTGPRAACADKGRTPIRPPRRRGTGRRNAKPKWPGGAFAAGTIGSAARQRRGAGASLPPCWEWFSGCAVLPGGKDGPDRVAAPRRRHTRGRAGYSPALSGMAARVARVALVVASWPMVSRAMRPRWAMPQPMRPVTRIAMESDEK